jgi:hypothetical protein
MLSTRCTEERFLNSEEIFNAQTVLIFRRSKICLENPLILDIIVFSYRPSTFLLEGEGNNNLAFPVDGGRISFYQGIV